MNEFIPGLMLAGAVFVGLYAIRFIRQVTRYRDQMNRLSRWRPARESRGKRPDQAASQTAGRVAKPKP